MRSALKKFFAFFGLRLLSLKTYNQIIRTKKTYAQIGEDVIVSYVFALKGITMPSYLDIGANDPKHRNNTFLFYQRGARGINIDANPFSVEKFLKQRPGDINLHLGIGEGDSEFEFYIMEKDELSTFSKEVYTNYLKLGHQLKEIIKVKTVCINKVVEQYAGNTMPDFLSIDTEGLDFEIISRLEFERFRPKVICVESSDHSADGVGTKRTELINYICGKEYFEYGNTWLNSILVDERWFFNKK